jgi:RNA polymerase sigma factor (sigma-70 family)
LEQHRHLIQACLKGKRQSQNELYSLLAPAMFAVCLRYSHSREEAEESLQEGFIRVFDCLRQFRFEGSFEGWVRKIMVNCALQKFRSRNALYAVPHAEAGEMEILSPEDITARLSTKELLALVQELPPACRLVFNLYVFEGQKHREIADLLNISEGTSKSNLSDARKILQRRVLAAAAVTRQNTQYV